MMTLPRLERDLLMFWASVSLMPSLPESLTLSLPAKSTLKEKVSIKISNEWDNLNSTVLDKNKKRIFQRIV